MFPQPFRPSADPSISQSSDISEWGEDMSFHDSTTFTSDATRWDVDSEPESITCQGEASRSMVSTSAGLQPGSFSQYGDMCGNDVLESETFTFGWPGMEGMTGSSRIDPDLAPGSMFHVPGYYDQNVPSRDFTLFDTVTTMTGGLEPLFHEPAEERDSHSDHTAESPAVTATLQSLYVNRGTSTPTDLPEPPVRNLSSSSPKNRAGRTRNGARSRMSTKRHVCTINSCNQDFGRLSDLHRHQHDFHCLSTKHFECQSNYCLYRTRRVDKMKEHCQKMHRHIKGKEFFRTVQSDRSTVMSPNSSLPS